MKYEVEKILTRILIILITAGSVGLADKTAKPSSKRPNIILMVADDMGWGEIGTYGGSRALTPNLCKLSESGMRFTQFYSGGSVCTPTRVSILTGRYPQRFGLFNGYYKDRGGNLGAEATTVAEILRDAGYATAHMGKWHLGGVRGIDVFEREQKKPDADPGPHEHGFQFYQTQIEDAGRRRGLVRSNYLYRKGGTILLRNEKRVPASDPYYKKHWEDCTGDFALDMIDQFHADDKPFFLNIWWYIPHTPIEPSPEPFMTRAKKDPVTAKRERKEGSTTEYSSMIAHLDHRVGMVVERLKKLGIYENTVIIFTSDNGGAWGALNGDLTCGKQSYFEGGIRVPGIFSWPGKVKPGTTDYIGHSNDLLPTICSIAGAKIPNKNEIDGVNLIPVVTGQKNLPDRGTLFWMCGRAQSGQRDTRAPFGVANAAREGKWKLCFSAKKSPVALFNIDADRSEKNNLIKNPEYKEIVERMQKAFIQHSKEPYIPMLGRDRKPIHNLKAP